MTDEYVASVVQSGNTRLSKVKRFLAKPAARAAALRMVAAGSEGEAQIPLGEWRREEVLPELALEILETLDDHAREMGGHITASLAYVDEGGTVVKTLVLQRQANHLAADASTGLLNPEDMNAQLTGDMRSQAAGAQRHLEVMSRIYLAGMAGLLAHSERLVTRQSEMLETLANRLGRAERRIDVKEAELEELLETLRTLKEADKSAGNEQPSSPAMERALAMLERLAPHLLQQFMAANTNGQRPRAQVQDAETDDVEVG